MSARTSGRRGTTWLISIAILVIMVLSGGSLAVGGVVAVVSHSPGLQATAQPTFTPIFYGKHLPAPQPSPYCNVGTPTSPFDVICYTPEDLKVAYNYPSYLDGMGQTIVIVDAFGSPTVQSDLNTFDTAFNLPPTTLQIVCQGGVCPVVNTADPDQLSWTGEIALDTQYAHAMAPGAHIVLFVATTDDDLTLEEAVLQAVTMFPHSIISQSFGDPETDMIAGTCFDLTDNPTGDCSPAYVAETLAVGEKAYRLAAREGTTVFAAAGDWGADNSGLCSYAGAPSPCPFTSADAIYPASSPWVTAVGGTQGDPYYLGEIPSCTGRTCSTGLVNFLNTPSCALNNPVPTGTESCIPIGYGGEQVWNEQLLDAATGGAPSLFFGAPSYQHGLGLTTRATPDVSYDASISGGVLVYWSVIPSEAGFSFSGGTSCGSPQWAAIAALADQYAAMHHRGTIGFINPALYLIGNTPGLYRHDLHDITVGNDTIAGSAIGFFATPGWDDASGWGTPNVANLVPDLVALSGGYH
jgi:subtilase family serine protease